jgi:hypothetical protein
MLVWQKELWLIDHGAALYFHHSWSGWKDHAVKPFVQVKDHVLLPMATQLQQADHEMKQLVTPEKIRAIIEVLPGEWLQATFDEPVEKVREIYSEYLITRLHSSGKFINEALDARK